jgi:dTDP-4-dehydrorhamnose reductase
VTRLFITGASGQLGSAIAAQFADCDLVRPSSRELNIGDGSAVLHAVAAARPDVVINCAAYNNVDLAEDHPEDALAINALAVRALARAAEETGAALVHYGTDFIFDGTASSPYTEQSQAAPRSKYGASKLLGEWFALEAPRGYVLRVESLFGTAPGFRGRRGSMDGIVSGLEQGREIPVFTDRVVSPGYVVDIAAATRHLLDTTAEPGVYHCTNSGSATWADIAEELARLLGVTPRLRRVSSDQVALKASRPRYSALSSDKLAAAGFPMPDWRDALRRWLAVRATGIATTAETSPDRTGA